MHGHVFNSVGRYVCIILPYILTKSIIFRSMHVRYLIHNVCIISICYCSVWSIKSIAVVNADEAVSSVAKSDGVSDCVCSDSNEILGDGE